MSEFNQKKVIIVILVFLTATAFFIRFRNFLEAKKSLQMTVDEVVYCVLARQLKNNLTHYDLLEYGNSSFIEERERKIPRYFTQPLFKHPPLFPLLAAGSLNLFADNVKYAYLVSLVFGVLLIPLTYLLGTIIFNRNIGLLSAAVITIDPINIISSQKIWMETTLSFFTLLTVYFFLYGFKYKKDNFYLLSGIAAGLAVLTKYPGILATLIVGLYVALYQRDVLKNRKFLLSITFPFLMLLPWIVWNYKVYGADFLAQQATIHNLLNNSFRAIFITVMLALTAAFIVIRTLAAQNLLNIKEIVTQGQKINLSNPKVQIILKLIAFLLLFKYIVKALYFFELPITSWEPGIFRYESKLFYLGKFIEFFFIYIFGYMAVLSSRKKEEALVPILKIGFFVVLIFYTFWGSYQSRYVLAAVPFLAILSVYGYLEILQRFSNHQNAQVKKIGTFVMVLTLIYSISRTMYINVMVSFPNNMCYF